MNSADKETVSLGHRHGLRQYGADILKFASNLYLAGQTNIGQQKTQYCEIFLVA